MGRRLGSIAGMVAVVCLIFAAAFRHEIALHMSAERRELVEILNGTDVLGSYFTHVRYVDGISNPRRPGRDPSQAHWHVHRRDGMREGFFRLKVYGFTKLMGERLVEQEIVVHFRKPSGGPIEITRIDPAYYFWPEPAANPPGAGR